MPRSRARSRSSRSSSSAKQTRQKSGKKKSSRSASSSSRAKQCSKSRKSSRSRSQSRRDRRQASSRSRSKNRRKSRSRKSRSRKSRSRNSRIRRSRSRKSWSRGQRRASSRRRSRSPQRRWNAPQARYGQRQAVQSRSAHPVQKSSGTWARDDNGDASDSSFDSARGASPETLAAGKSTKMAVLYWGGGLEGDGWDFSGRCRGGFPRIDRTNDALVDSWKGRMENAQVTLRICASEGPGFKRYMKHFQMLSSQGCVEYRLQQYHRFNSMKKRKVLTERIVIGAILEGHNGQLPSDSGMLISNGGVRERKYTDILKRRARRYRKQAHKLGGHFAAVVLEGNCEELKMLSAAKAVQEAQPKGNIKRLMLILGGPNGIPAGIREELREILEMYTDLPLLGVSLPGGILHSYYALATVLVFHDQGLLMPYLESRVGPLQSRSPPADRRDKQGISDSKSVNESIPKRAPAKPPSGPPPLHLWQAASGALLKPAPVGLQLRADSPEPDSVIGNIPAEALSAALFKVPPPDLPPVNGSTAKAAGAAPPLSLPVPPCPEPKEVIGIDEAPAVPAIAAGVALS